MKILVVTQYFWPESFIINDLVLHLHQQGHEVAVLTGKPNYPGGTVFEGYVGKGVQQECFAGKIDVFRVPLRPRNACSARDLALNYLSFVWSGLRHFSRQIHGREFDAILVFAPSPITAAIPAILLKWTKKAHLAIWIQDLWPESLAATGHVKNPVLLKLAEWAVRGIYRFADTLLIQSRAFHGAVSRLTADDGKIVYYPNSIDFSSGPGTQEFPLPAALVELLQTRFCLVFAGNIGTAQSVETIVRAAELLKKESDIRIVMVGSGSMLDWVRSRKEALQLDNLILAGRFPMHAMPEIYRYAAGLIVTLKDEDIFALTVPSKIQAYLASGRPIVAALNGEGARIVEAAGAGLTCAAEDAEGLANRILTLQSMSEDQRRAMGKRGHDYFQEHFEMKRQAERLVDILAARIATVKGGH